MNIFRKLFHRHKSEHPKRERVNLHQLENHFILHVGLQRCDLCKMETLNCQKIDIADQCICLCPRKDIKGIRRPKKEDK